MKKIIETAIANGSLKTLVTAIKAADLAETLSRPGVEQESNTLY